MRIKEALKKYHKIEIELLLAHVLRKPKEFLFLFPQHELTRIQANRLTRMAQRRLLGEPVAYILGYKDFYGLRFKVNKNVLIPRPETEMVVDLVLAKLRSPSPIHGEGARRAGEVKHKDLTFLSRPLPKDERQQRAGHLPMKWGECSADDLATAPIKILDLGTGSGCIIISLAKTLTLPSPRGRGKLQFYASDISSVALKVAKQNAKAHGVKVKFIHTNILENVRMTFDIIVANLPYLSEGWKTESAELKYEPKEALFAKESGLMIIHKLLEQIVGLKQKPRLVYLEFDPRQKRLLTKLIKKSLPGSKTKFYKDYAGLWRCVEIMV